MYESDLPMAALLDRPTWGAKVEPILMSPGITLMSTSAPCMDERYKEVWMSEQIYEEYYETCIVLGGVEDQEWYARESTLNRLFNVIVPMTEQPIGMCRVITFLCCLWQVRCEN